MIFSCKKKNFVSICTIGSLLFCILHVSGEKFEKYLDLRVISQPCKTRRTRSHESQKSWRRNVPETAEKRFCLFSVSFQIIIVLLFDGNNV